MAGAHGYLIRLRNSSKYCITLAEINVKNTVHRRNPNHYLTFFLSNARLKSDHFFCQMRDPYCLKLKIWK